MAEKAEPTKADNGTDPEKTGTADPAEGKTPDNTANNNEGFDPTKIADDDFENIFKDPRLFTHPRFKSLSERAKRADELEKTQTEAETKALEEQKKFEELYAKEKAAKEALEAKVKQQGINAALASAASKVGVVDLDAVTKLADASGVEIADDGTVTGADEAVAKLIEDKPYLAGKPIEKKIGEGTNPGADATDAGTKKFKLSQLNDAKFYQENEADILQAWKLGLIEDDTSQ